MRASVASNWARVQAQIEPMGQQIVEAAGTGPLTVMEGLRDVAGGNTETDRRGRTGCDRS